MVAASGRFIMGVVNTLPASRSRLLLVLVALFLFCPRGAFGADPSPQAPAPTPADKAEKPADKPAEKKEAPKPADTSKPAEKN